MAFKMVHTQNRLVQRCPQGARHARTNQQSSGQAGAPRVGNHINLGKRAARSSQHLLGKRQHSPNVVTAGQFGHYTTESLVHFYLAIQRVCQQVWHALGA